jgi:hypothetical protein
MDEREINERNDLVFRLSSIVERLETRDIKLLLDIASRLPLINGD